MRKTKLMMQTVGLERLHREDFKTMEETEVPREEKAAGEASDARQLA
jgi:hypothetical protein